MKHDFTSFRTTAFLLLLLLLTTLAHSSDRRVLIIGIDGFRADAMETADMPHLHALFRKGAGFYSRGFNECSTVSAPNWTTILHGVQRDRHNIHDNTPYPEKDFAPFPNLIYRLKQHNPALNTAAIYTWDYLNHNLQSPDGVDYKLLHNMLDPKGAEGVDWQSDDKVAAAMADHLTRRNPHVAFLYLGMPDIIGHRHGFFPTSEKYMQQLARTDAHIGRVLSALEGRAGVKQKTEEWLILITTDHGGKASHVTNEFKIREIPFIMHGPGVSTSPVVLKPRNLDVARTVLTWMGVPQKAQEDLEGHVIGLSPETLPKVDFHQNLIVNGDGEYDHGFDKHTFDQVIAGWQDQQLHPDNGFESMTLMRYGAPDGYPSSEAPGPSNRGRNFFAGGSQGPESVMTQRCDLQAMRQAIDAGEVDFVLSGWLGGFIDQPDRMELSASFLDEQEQVLATVQLPAVTHIDRGNVTGLIERKHSATVPAGTRTVLISLRAIRDVGLNDGYADNLSFVLTPHSAAKH